MLLQRILTVVIASPFLIGAIVCPWPEVFKGVVVLCVAGGFLEYFAMAGFARGERLFMIVVGLAHTLYFLFCPALEATLLIEIPLLLFLIFLFYLVGPAEKPDSRKAALSLLGILTIGSLGAFVGLLRDLPDGVFWVFIVLAMTWLNDTAAYFVGHRYGRHRLAPRISPGKTVEGFFGGFAGSLAGFLLFWLIFGRPVPLTDGLWLTLLVGLFGPLGDLSESLLKRGFGVKDSGTLIPGHGGVLDRIDALLFAAPVVYFYAAYL